MVPADGDAAGQTAGGPRDDASVTPDGGGHGGVRWFRIGEIAKTDPDQWDEQEELGEAADQFGLADVPCREGNRAVEQQQGDEDGNGKGQPASGS